MAGVVQEIDDFGELRRRQVVDAVVAGILQDLERDALAGPGEPADQD
jgi:hypothetical protein